MVVWTHPSWLAPAYVNFCTVESNIEYITIMCVDMLTGDGIWKSKTKKDSVKPSKFDTCFD
jgi:hypothetical protein